jgi:hypothetical protein
VQELNLLGVELEGEEGIASLGQEPGIVRPAVMNQEQPAVSAYYGEGALWPTVSEVVNRLFLDLGCSSSSPAAPRSIL